MQQAVSIGREFHFEQREWWQKLLEEGLPRLMPLLGYFRQFIKDPKVAERVFFYLLPLFQIPSGNGKTPSAFQILCDDEARGLTRGRVCVIPSSGNTAANIAVMASAFGLEEVWAIVDSNIPKGKIGQLHLAGAKVVHPPKGRSTIEHAEDLAREHGFYLADQYKHRGSLEGHLRYTWPHVVRELNQLEIAPSILSVALGTTSLYVSGNMALRRHWPDLSMVGAVCASEEEKIPGARTIKGLGVTGFDYQKVGGTLIPCPMDPVRAMMCRCFRMGCSGGFTFAMSLVAVCEHINQRAASHELDSIANDRGEINVLMVGMDAAAAYTSEFA